MIAVGRLALERVGVVVELSSERSEDEAALTSSANLELSAVGRLALDLVGVEVVVVLLVLLLLLVLRGDLDRLVDSVLELSDRDVLSASLRRVIASLRLADISTEILLQGV